MLALGLAVLIFISGNIWQFRRNSQLLDNDLKYRYIKMVGNADRKTLIKLENIFSYHRDKDSISTIRKQVKNYERFVRKQMEHIEQKRLNAFEMKDEKEN